MERRDFMRQAGKRRDNRKAWRQYKRSEDKNISQTNHPSYQGVGNDYSRALFEGVPAVDGSRLTSMAVATGPSSGLVRSIQERPDYDSMRFGKAFNAAKAAGAKVFTWKGKQYAVVEDPNWKFHWRGDLDNAPEGFKRTLNDDIESGTITDQAIEDFSNRILNPEPQRQAPYIYQSPVMYGVVESPQPEDLGYQDVYLTQRTIGGPRRTVVEDVVFDENGNPIRRRKSGGSIPYWMQMIVKS